MIKSQDSCTSSDKKADHNGIIKSTTTSVKSQHKVEGKNKKSLHQKQQANQQQQQKTSTELNQRKSPSSPTNRKTNISQKNLSNNCSTKIVSTSSGDNKNLFSNSDSNTKTTNEQVICLTLDDFAKRAVEIKSEINKALEKQTSHKIIDQPVEVVKLKNDIIKLSNLQQENMPPDSQTKENVVIDNKENKIDNSQDGCEKIALNDINIVENEVNKKLSSEECSSEDIENNQKLTDINQTSSQEKIQQSKESSDEFKETSEKEIGSELETVNTESKNVIKTTKALDIADNIQTLNDNKNSKQLSNNNRQLIEKEERGLISDKNLITNNSVNLLIHNNDNNNNDGSIMSKKLKLKNSLADDGFEPLLNAKLDTNSKVVALESSLKKMFKSEEPNQLVELVCRKLVNISEQNARLTESNEKYQLENQKLLLIKQKLENLCRELQKSNNAIRIESLDLIKVEQGKAKEQTTKIQSTLSGVIKLFDENQQRNMSLRQENQELQTKLKSLLDHCDNWEKSVEAALRQKDIENRLIKTELAKANLLKNEEKEKFLGEKQELLQILSMMQEQQHRIEGQEAKLRSDLSSYASKYDECQAVISKGMNRFQTESKKMLKQIEKSKQDYKVLLSKYESSNKRMAQLLEEKQSWDKSMTVANKKIATLEKLCRALKEQKSDCKNESIVKDKQQKLSNNNDNKNKVKSNNDNKKLRNVTMLNETGIITTNSDNDSIETIKEEESNQEKDQLIDNMEEEKKLIDDKIEADVEEKSILNS